MSEWWFASLFSRHGDHKARHFGLANECLLYEVCQLSSDHPVIRASEQTVQAPCILPFRCAGFRHLTGWTDDPMDG